MDDIRKILETNDLIPECELTVEKRPPFSRSARRSSC